MSKKYEVVGPVPVHNCEPGQVVEPTEDWDVDFLITTGHLELVEPAPKASKSTEVEENE